jgi:hypothetical protein
MAYAIDSITISPLISDFLASMTLNGKLIASDISSVKLPLLVGSNVFTIIVTGRDGQTSKTYTVSVNRSSIFPYVQSFKNALASGTIFGGTPNSALLTGGGIDAEGQGYLRLTSNTNNQNGFAHNTSAFPTANGQGLMALHFFCTMQQQIHFLLVVLVVL